MRELFHIWVLNEHGNEFLHLEWVDRHGRTVYEKSAVWGSRQGADNYGRNRFGEGGFQVRLCEGSGCGMRGHGEWQNEFADNLEAEGAIRGRW